MTLSNTFLSSLALPSPADGEHESIRQTSSALLEMTHGLAINGDQLLGVPQRNEEMTPKPSKSLVAETMANDV